MLHATHTLPPLAADEQAHSERLIALIRDEINKNHGWIGFVRYMELALYAPGLGYYSAGAQKLGSSGDFITAPEISPLFSRCVANQCAQALHSLQGGDVLELGAGSGMMAVDVLLQLEKLNALPTRYYILEVSADLRQRQQTLLQERIPHLMDRLCWLDSLPDSFNGIIVANEVLDAIPVTRFIIEDGKLRELGIGIEENQFVWRSRPPRDGLIKNIEHITTEIGGNLPLGYCSEINLQLPDWIKSLEIMMQQGVLLFLDYGLPRKQYYSMDRTRGTFSCFYRHLQHDDPFINVGVQDLTTWVDFTALAEAGVNAGLELTGFSTQAHFLIGSGIESLLTDAMTQNDLSDTQRWQLAQQVQQLMLPDGMGETFKAMAFTKNCELELSGFAFRDLRHSL